MARFNHFSVKFIDLMFGLVLGLGFQWWVGFSYLWQYIAFIFAYIDIVDYWVDYSTQVKKFMRREIDLILDTAIMFLLFLYIYYIQVGIIYFLVAFVLIRVVDTIGFFRTVSYDLPTRSERLFLNTWAIYGAIEIALTLIIMGIYKYLLILSDLQALLIFIGMRVAIRFLISHKYKSFYLK